MMTRTKNFVALSFEVQLLETTLLDFDRFVVKELSTFFMVYMEQMGVTSTGTPNLESRPSHV
jgi:hypothetical protein